MVVNEVVCSKFAGRRVVIFTYCIDGLETVGEAKHGEEEGEREDSLGEVLKAVFRRCIIAVHAHVLVQIIVSTKVLPAPWLRTNIR